MWVVANRVPTGLLRRRAERAIMGALDSLDVRQSKVRIPARALVHQAAIQRVPLAVGRPDSDVARAIEALGEELSWSSGMTDLPRLELVPVTAPSGSETAETQLADQIPEPQGQAPTETAAAAGQVPEREVARAPRRRS